jgi:hypothetical protein
LKERDPWAKVTVSSILHREQSKNDFKVIRLLLKVKNNSNISHLDVPSDEDANSWKSISEPVLMEKHLINRNITHFGQANVSELSTGILGNYFEYKGTHLHSAALINKAVKPPMMDLHSTTFQHIINELGNKEKSPDISGMISFQVFWDGFKKWNERTTTSPSGQHLGHYKFLLRLNIFNTKNNNLSEKILMTYYNMIC